MPPQRLRLVNAPVFEESVSPGPGSVAASTSTTKSGSNACVNGNAHLAGAISFLDDEDVSSVEETWMPDAEGEDDTTNPEGMVGTGSPCIKFYNWM